MKYLAGRGMAVCGLACVLCSDRECEGCKGAACEIARCAAEKKVSHCHECDACPCDKDMHKGVRMRAFNQYAKDHGQQALLKSLRVNHRHGIAYHRADGIKGDYDSFETQQEVYDLLKKASTRDLYQECPRYETKHFVLRLVQEADAPALLRCYGDLLARPLFNADCCTSDFCYDTIGQMQECIAFFLESYRHRAFIRFSILDKQDGLAVGTVEMFHSESGLGILRIDLVSAYEQQELLEDLLELATEHFYELFDVNSIAVKAVPEAEERIKALRTAGFEPFDWPENPPREHYYIKHS